MEHHKPETRGTPVAEKLLTLGRGWKDYIRDEMWVLHYRVRHVRLLVAMPMMLCAAYFGTREVVSYSQRVLDMSPTSILPHEVIRASTWNVTYSDIKDYILPLINGYWHNATQEGVEIYIFSVYYDNRPDLRHPHVRIITVAEVVNISLTCLLWFSQTDTSLANAIQIVSGPEIEIYTKLFTAYIYSCAVPLKRVPKHVSILMSNIRTVNNHVPVRIPQRAAKRDFLLCVSVAYGILNPIRLIEWIEIHKMWGVSKIAIYNNSISPSSRTVLRYYERKGYVEIHDSPNCRKDDGESTILLNMSPSLNDCMYRNLYLYKKVIVVDLDEMIVPRIHRTYTEMLEYIDSVEPPSNPHQSYIFTNAYFFLDYGPNSHKPWLLTTMKYLKRVQPSPAGYSAKSITDPMACVALQNHLCWRRIRKYDKGPGSHSWVTVVDTNIAMNHHYKRCHLDDYEHVEGLCNRTLAAVFVDKTMLRFQQQLLTRVQNVLRDIQRM